MRGFGLTSGDRRENRTATQAGCGLLRTWRKSSTSVAATFSKLSLGGGKVDFIV